MLTQYIQKSPLYGIYQIDSDSTTRRTIPNDWVLLIFEYDGRVIIRDKYYQAKYEQTTIDSKKKTVSLNNFTLEYQITKSGDIILKKVLDDKTETVRLSKLHPQEFELMKRSFNWVQEYPYSR